MKNKALSDKLKYIEPLEIPKRQPKKMKNLRISKKFSMKKLLLITMLFPPKIGGVETMLANIAKRLDPNNLTVLADQENEKGLTKEEKKFDAAQKYRIIRRKFLYPSKLIWPRWLPILKNARKICKEEKIEAIFAAQVLPVGTAAMKIAQAFDIPYYVYTYGMDVEISRKHWIRGRTLKNVLKNSARIFTISDFTKRRIEELGINEKKMVKIPPGLDIKKFIPGKSILAKQTEDIKKRYDLHNKKIILTLGRLVARKGQDTVIKSMPKILQEIPNAVYVIAGRGEYKKELKKLAETKQCSNHVNFAGQFDEKEKAALYNACDVFAMPTRIEKDIDVEGFGIVFLEANALGKPVIAGKSGGVEDAVIGDKTGLLIEDPTDETEVAEKIVRVLNDEELAERLGKAGKNRVENEFDWDRLVRQLEKYL
ncbi:MAG: hypothetical protein ACD_63C00024G0002 [uncultured bacterium]|nr:MAG: hypothetical protein ACD_63C00024G0002 [uncultured bacterium]